MYIESTLAPVLSCEAGKSVMKSIEMMDHGCCGTGRGFVSPYRAVCVE